MELSTPGVVGLTSPTPSVQGNALPSSVMVAVQGGLSTTQQIPGGGGAKGGGGCGDGRRRRTAVATDGVEACGKQRGQCGIFTGIDPRERNQTHSHP